MALLVFIRHGQAGSLEGDYDRLSPLGATQTRHLGAYWGQHRGALTRAWRGPLHRQRLSWQSLSEGLEAAGAAPPRVEIDAGWTEYEALKLFRVALPRLADSDPRVTSILASLERGEGDGGRLKERLFRHLTRRWVRGELDVPEVVPFAVFRRTVEAALTRLVAAVEDEDTVAVVTSGGVVSAVVGSVLGLDDERTLDLTWVVRNASITELRHRDGELSLLSFNGLPHLADRPDLVTFI